MACCTGYTFTPAPDAALDPNQRVNFTFGMVLGVDDFRQEHAWLAERDARALRELIGYGAISGLDVTTTTSGTQVEVRVTPGLALLPDGKLVGVGVPQCARLDEWLAGPGKPVGVPASAPGPSSKSTVYVVLRHVEVTGTPVPIPGEPCRDESALLADSRIASSFTLDFSWTPPAQTEDHALRIFTTWLRRLKVHSGQDVATSLASFQLVAEMQLAQAIQNAAMAVDIAAPEDPPDSSPPETSLPDTTLSIPCEHYAAYVNAAFDIWVRRLRGGVLAHFGPVPQAEDSAEAGLLLAAIDIQLDGDKLWFPAPPRPAATVRWLGRAQLVHLRLLQEWLIASSERDAPFEADYLLGRADPRLPNAQDLQADFASNNHALARIDLVPSQVPGEASALKAVLRPALIWPGTADASRRPDYYGPGMMAPIPVKDGGTGQAAPPQKLQVLVGDHDGADGRFVMARLADSPTVSVSLQQSTVGSPPSGDWQIVLNATGGGTGTGGSNISLRPATPGRHIAVVQAGADVTIDTTRQTHWATRIVEISYDRLRDDDHVVLLTTPGFGGLVATFELGVPQDERVVVIKVANPTTTARLVRWKSDSGQDPFIDQSPSLQLEEFQAVTLIGSEKLGRWLVIGRG